MKILTYLLKFNTIFFSLIALSLLSNQALANDLSIEHGYIRATIPGTNVSSAYMEINNLTEQEAVLVGVSTGVSDRVEIHEHVMKGELMRMQKRETLTIGAHDHVSLQPSGYHLMIFNLTNPLLVDEKVVLTFHFLAHKDVTITIPVQSIKRKKQQKPAHHHHH
ncbi:copper chaperone PCu(A)C [Colwelliaceae bacterium 6441]